MCHKLECSFIELDIIATEEYVIIINTGALILEHVSDSIFHRTLLGYYAEGMHANFKENLI